MTAIRSGAIRCRLMENELSAIGIALRDGLIDCETAMAWVYDVGALELVRVLPEPESVNLTRE